MRVWQAPDTPAYPAPPPPAALPPQEWMLLQMDGSRHDWLEGRGPYLTLVGAIDDTPGTVPHALFREQEDGQGYLLPLWVIIGSQGVPLAIYSDRHGIFQVNPKKGGSLEEKLAGKRQPTQVGRALEELGIQSIVALSPQAKGRVERLWGTFQYRLVSELCLAGPPPWKRPTGCLGTTWPGSMPASPCLHPSPVRPTGGWSLGSAWKGYCASSTSERWPRTIQ